MFKISIFYVKNQRKLFFSAKSVAKKLTDHNSQWKFLCQRSQRILTFTSKNFILKIPSSIANFFNSQTINVKYDEWSRRVENNLNLGYNVSKVEGLCVLFWFNCLRLVGILKLIILNKIKMTFDIWLRWKKLCS